MSKFIDTNKPESRNWLKQWRAVYVTRQALLPTVSEEAAQLHEDILNKAQVPSCIKCSSNDVKNKNAKCKYHVVLRDELVDAHAYGQAKGIGALTLKNTKAENWVHSPWEIAKVFMPPAGYEDKTTIEETDFNGIAAFIINCKRLHGKITGTICEKAREVVNHIRHMPDFSSTALTDQATTECIDSLYALLNEPGMKTRQEAMQAQTQLDELKTLKDGNVYYSICQKLHVELEQKLSYIERKLHANEIDTERAKESIHSQSQQFQKDREEVLLLLERISNDAKQDLTRTKDGILLSIEEERRSFKENITSLERTTVQRIEQYVTDCKRALEIHATEEQKRATEHIEQSVTDAQRTLDIHVKEERTRATEHIEHSVTEGKRALEDQTEILARLLRKEEVDNLQKKKHELKVQLIDYYKISSSQMTVRLDIDETIEKIYEKPKLTLKKTENGTIQEKDIPEVSQLFSKSDGTIAKTIIVEGEPGTGKTSLCKKIVDDWRKVNEKVEQEPVTSYIRKFEFIFYIILRFVKTEFEVKAIIVEHILKKIDSGYENAHSLLGEILKSEHCLLLLDGLDEWRGKMPHIETSWLNCTTLITTRPYKLAELKVIPTQMGKHVKLDGVKNPEELVLKVIRKLEEYHKTNKQPKSCILDLKGIKLWHFSANPVVLVHIVWLWQKGKLRENMSRSFLYQKIIDERWHEMCDKKEQDKHPQELYDVLSEIAFDKLFSENEDESLVFNIKEKQLQKFKQYKDTSLESGIMSASNVPGERFPQYQFLHKTFQEFLAAVFLSKHDSTISTSCNLVKEIYLNHRNKGTLDLKELYLFLCGLNPDAAAEFSKTLNELFTEDLEKEGLAWRAHAFQNMILGGYDEAERIGHIGAEFCLQHIVLYNSTNITAHRLSKLKLCLENERKSNLKSIHIEKNIASALQTMDDPSVLDLEICTNLKRVALERLSYEDINLSNLNGLLDCNIHFSDYKPASKLISSVQSSDLRGLKILVLRNVGLECEAMDILSKLKCVKELNLTWSKASRPNVSQLNIVDLRHLEYLEELTLNELHASDVVSLQMLNLRHLKIGFGTQQRAPRLVATLLSRRDGSLTTLPDGSHFPLEGLRLKNVCMLAGEYMRLLNQMLQSGRKVEFTLTECTIEGDVRELHEKVGDQAALQVKAPQPVLPLNTTYIRLEKVTVSADVFMRLVLVVLLQSRRLWYFTLTECTIEGDVRELHEKVGDQAALQVEAPQSFLTSTSTHIRLEKVTVSADVFMRLVLVVLQSGHVSNFTFTECTIEGDVRELHEKVGNQASLQVEAPQSFLTIISTRIRLEKMTVSADVFMRLVLVVSQSGREVNFTLTDCTIEGDIRELHEKMGDRTALQVVTPQPGSYGCQPSFILEKVTVSADMFLRLVLVMSQSGREVNFTLTECTIEGDVRELHEKAGDKTALQVEAPQSFFTLNNTNIRLEKMTVSADVFMRLVLVVLLQSRRLWYFTLTECTIEGDVRELHEKVGDQAALQVEAPQSFLTSTSTHIRLEKTTVSADVFMRLVLVLLQSRRLWYFTLTAFTIEGDVRELHEKVEDQTALQEKAPQYFLTRTFSQIRLEKVTVSADVFLRLVLVVSQSRRLWDFTLTECTIKGDVRELHEKVGDQAALQVEAPRPAVTIISSDIRLEKTTVSADVFMRLVLVVLQFGHEVDFTLTKCTIEGDVRELHEKVGDQAVLQVEAPQPASSGFITYRISLQEAIVPAEVLRALVSGVLQLERRVSCKLQNCTIEPVEEVRKLQVKMEDQPAIDVEGFSMCGQVWCIQFSNNRLPVHAVR